MPEINTMTATAPRTRRTREQEPTPLALLQQDSKTDAGQLLRQMVQRMANGQRDEGAAALGLRALELARTKLETARAHANLAAVYLSLGAERPGLFTAAFSHAWKAIRADGGLLTPYVTLLEASLRARDEQRLSAAWTFWSDADLLSDSEIAELLWDDWELERSRHFVRLMREGSSVHDTLAVVASQPR